MRFYSEGPSIPDALLQRRDDGRVVFLCGAGVSVPSGMPSFLELTQYVIECLVPSDDSEVMTAFRPWLSDQSAANTPLDQIFNLLHIEYGRDEINALVTERLSAPLNTKGVGHTHALIKRISSSQRGIPQIVTTNFDRLFEASEKGERVVCHEPPGLPDLKFGTNIEGITYLHGRLTSANAEEHPYVLSSADFGRAYLAEGWATNFIRHLLERYTVVLVGYQAEDPPVKYLLQGLNHNGQHDRSKLFAFDLGIPEKIESKWRDRGVTAIAYSNHADLWKSMEAWADRADDPRRWRASQIAKSQNDPKLLTPHDRGQVAHVLRTTQGAKLFSEVAPPPHPEWICVMDANVRSSAKIKGYSIDTESFDPRAAYGLDDDLIDISEEDRRRGIKNDNLLVWREDDDSPNQFHRLGGREVEGFEATPARLDRLINWISKTIDSPVLAWWAIRQNGLHPRLLNQLDWQVKNSETLHARARHVWNLILESQRDHRSLRWNGDWFKLDRRINVEGWTPAVLRDFRRITKPRLNISPAHSIGQSRPPQTSWQEVRIDELGQFSVALFDRHGKAPDIPDDLLSQVLCILEDQLTIASGLLSDTETTYYETPTCYPNRNAHRVGRASNDADAFNWLISLFDRISEKWPELANAHATKWPTSDRFFFRKLKLYALNKKGSFKSDYVAKLILSLNQEDFWDTNVARELLFLLTDRWEEFHQKYQNKLIDRILKGPDQPTHLSKKDSLAIRNNISTRYARYIELQGCKLSPARSARLAAAINGIQNWNDSWASSIVHQNGSHFGWVGKDENPDAIANIPVNKIVCAAKEASNRDFDSFTEKRPFAGLVKTNPQKALSALTISGKTNYYPVDFWTDMITELPSEINPRLRRTFLNRLAQLPHHVIADMRHALSRWLEQHLVATLGFDEALGWRVYDHIVAGMLSGGADAAKSALGDVRQGGKVLPRSRRTFDHAINGPIGKCAEALFNAVPGETQAANSLIPAKIKSRVEQLFEAPGEGSDHAVSIATSKLNWIMFCDPAWATERIAPMLAFDNTASEPAWSGFLHSGRVPWTPLREIVKPCLLKVFPWVEELAWDRDSARVAAVWLGFMRVFHPDEKSGLSRVEARTVLRAMSDENRCRLIFWLIQVGQNNENGWSKHVIPFIDGDWPRERQYRTSTSVNAWISMLHEAGDNFSSVYEAVKRFIVPVEVDDHPIYRFTGDYGNKTPITAAFPESTLDLLHRVTPKSPIRPPHDLPKILAIISETRPILTSDPRYLRLIDLAERS